MLTACLCLALAAVEPERPGGANSPEPSPPVQLVIQTQDVDAGAYAVRIPTGSYTAPAGGAPAYTVPGPIVAFRGADKVWRGHGYLETYPRLRSFTAEAMSFKKTPAGLVAGHRLDYRFENHRAYTVEVVVLSDRVLLSESGTLGPRDLWVFDAYYQWQPTGAFTFDAGCATRRFLTLPCFYDRPEVTIRPAELIADAKGKPAGVAVASPETAITDVAGLWVRDLPTWTGADGWGIQLWQRRQIPGDPASRHFLGPDTKSDSTPNPRTAPLLGKSLYEGHVTIELSLGTGNRQLGFAVAAKGPEGQVAAPFAAIVAADR